MLHHQQVTAKVILLLVLVAGLLLLGARIPLILGVVVLMDLGELCHLPPLPWLGLDLLMAEASGEEEIDKDVPCLVALVTLQS
jgi:hypothetical protein